MKRIDILILLSVTLVHLVSSGLAAGSVLCFGADGHVTLESRAASCCAKVDDGSLPCDVGPALSTISGDRSCGDCIDIAVPASVSRTSSSPAMTPAHQLCLAAPP